MQRRNSLMMCLIMASLLLVFCPAVRIEAANIQAEFHVATTGNDDNPGTSQKPFKTIARAQKAVREINASMKDDIVVVLHGGTYTISKPIVFGSADSGSGGHRVIYRAAPGEQPTISGGRRITGWQADSGGRWKAKTDLDDFRQLYVDWVRAVRARSGKLASNSDPIHGKFVQYFTNDGMLQDAEPVGNKGYRTTAVEMAEWRNIPDIEFCYLGTPQKKWSWCHTRCKVKSITRDGDHAVVEMLQPHFEIARTKPGIKIALPDYIENAFELLDEPGEWYLDRSTKTLYYIPRAGEDMQKAEVIAPAVEKLLELRGTLDRPVENICFEGITFRHGSWLLPSRIGLCDVQANFIVDIDKNYYQSAHGFRNNHNENLKSPANVVCHAARSIRFDRCSFEQLGGAGLDIEYGSQDNTVLGCRFRDIAGSAIQIGDVLKDDHHPDDVRKIVKNNTVINCIISDCCLDYMGGIGIFAGYTEGTRLAHNEICSLPYSGISLGWGWGMEDTGGGNYTQPHRYDTPTPAKNNLVEWNHIHHVGQLLTDVAGVYTLSNQPGTIIRGNHIHNNGGEPGGIYLDEGSGFIEVTNNLIYHVSEPIHFNNLAQNRKATCKQHGNLTKPDSNSANKVIEEAGLEPEYRELIKNPVQFQHE